MIINLEKKFNPEVIAKATEAMVQRVYFNNPQPLNTFLDNLELQHPKELENITTPLNRLGFSWEDFDVSEKSWPLYFEKSALAILRRDIEYCKASGTNPDSILNNRQNLLE